MKKQIISLKNQDNSTVLTAQEQISEGLGTNL